MNKNIRKIRIYQLLVIASGWFSLWFGILLLEKTTYADNSNLIASTKDSDNCYPKLDRYLQILNYKYKNGLLKNSSPGAEIYLRLLVKTNNAQINPTQLPIVSKNKDILTSYCSLKQLDSIAQQPEIVRVEIGSDVLETKYHSTNSTGFTIDREVFKASNLSSGSGVIIGIIDSGLALSNCDFYNPLIESSSIIYVWDQIDQSGNSPIWDGQTFGTEYGANDINTAIKNETFITKDIRGHGTLVASLCAGRWGIAPDASIIFVRTCGAKADILDGVRYIFRKANLLGKPCVINLSYGKYYGGNDGLSLFEEALEAEVGNGHILVCSAGNKLSGSTFAFKSSSGNLVNIHLETNPNKMAFSKSINREEPPLIDVCGSFNQVHVCQSSLGNRVGTIRRGEVGRLRFPNGVSLYFAWEHADSIDKMDHLLLQWDGIPQIVSSQDWFLQFSPKQARNVSTDACLIKAWIVQGHQFVRFCEQGNTHCPDIFSPATANGVIAVASCNQKENVSEFSPLPYRIRGAYKPNYYVCGENVLASSPYKREENCDRHAMRVTGTSFSSALLSGCIALLLQNYPSMSPTEIISTLNKFCKNGSSNETILKNPVIKIIDAWQFGERLNVLSHQDVKSSTFKGGEF